MRVVGGAAAAAAILAVGARCEDLRGVPAQPAAAAPPPTPPPAAAGAASSPPPESADPRDLAKKGKKGKGGAYPAASGNPPVFVPVLPAGYAGVGATGTPFYPSSDYRHGGLRPVQSYDEMLRHGAAYQAVGGAPGPMPYVLPVQNELYGSLFPRALAGPGAGVPLPSGSISPAGPAPSAAAAAAPFIDPYEIDPFTVEGFYAPALLGSLVAGPGGVAQHTLATDGVPARALKAKKGPVGSGPYGYGINQFYAPHKALVQRRGMHEDPFAEQRLVLDGPHVYNRDAFAREVYRTDGLPSLPQISAFPASYVVTRHALPQGYPDGGIYPVLAPTVAGTPFFGYPLPAPLPLPAARAFRSLNAQPLQQAMETPVSPLDAMSAFILGVRALSALQMPLQAGSPLDVMSAFVPLAGLPGAYRAML